jgi:hypothetical protein
MQKFISFLFLLVSITFISKSQNKTVEAPNLPIDADTKLITYKYIENETGTKDELYERALLWFKSYYKNSTDVLREIDKANSKIKGVARFQVFSKEKDLVLPKAAIEYTIIMEFKDGRYRTTITNFNVKHASYFPLERWLNKKDPQYSDKNNLFLAQIDKEINKLLDNQQKEMMPKEKKKDDW